MFLSQEKNPILKLLNSLAIHPTYVDLKQIVRKISEYESAIGKTDAK